MENSWLHKSIKIIFCWVGPIDADQENRDYRSPDSQSVLMVIEGDNKQHNNNRQWKLTLQTDI